MVAWLAKLIGKVCSRTKLTYNRSKPSEPQDAKQGSVFTALRNNTPLPSQLFILQPFQNHASDINFASNALINGHQNCQV